MSTTTRPQLSEKNKYFVEKHRYYELKHFCLQYNIWKKAYQSLDGLSRRQDALDLIIGTNSISNPTQRCAIAKEYYSKRIDMVEKAARDTDEILGEYILIAVTNGYSYDTLKVSYKIPCGKDFYYDLYRRFFWLLNKIRE